MKDFAKSIRTGNSKELTIIAPNGEKVKAIDYDQWHYKCVDTGELVEKRYSKVVGNSSVCNKAIVLKDGNVWVVLYANETKSQEFETEAEAREFAKKVGNSKVGNAKDKNGIELKVGDVVAVKTGDPKLNHGKIKRISGDQVSVDVTGNDDIWTTPARLVVKMGNSKVWNKSNTKEEAKTKDEYFKLLKFYQTQGYKTKAGEYNPNGRIKLHKGDDSVEIVLVGNSKVENVYKWEQMHGHLELYNPAVPFGGHSRGFVEKTKTGYIGAKANGSIVISKKEFATEEEAKKYVENKKVGNSSGTYYKLETEVRYAISEATVASKILSGNFSATNIISALSHCKQCCDNAIKLAQEYDHEINK